VVTGVKLISRSLAEDPRLFVKVNLTGVPVGVGVGVGVAVGVGVGVDVGVAVGVGVRVGIALGVGVGVGVGLAVWPSAESAPPKTRVPTAANRPRASREKADRVAVVRFISEPPSPSWAPGGTFRLLEAPQSYACQEWCQGFGH